MSETVLELKAVKNYVLMTINRPRALNALNENVLNHLDHFFSKGYRDYEDLKGIVITGTGQKSFVAGADIAELQKLTKDSAMNFIRRGHRVFNTIENFHVPVIAAVNGFALGGGCELAMSCHLRIASDNARFGLPELSLGLIPGYGGTQRLTRYIGKTKALEFMLTSRLMDAVEAEKLGLVNQIVEVENLIESCFNMLDKIAQNGPSAIKYAIACINHYYDDHVDGFEKEIELFSKLVVSEEGKEGTLAFLEKRKPDF